MPTSARLAACGAALVLGGVLAAAGARPYRAGGSADLAGCGETHGQVITHNLNSPVYGAPVPYEVYLPPCYDAADAPLPVMYLLHASGLDQTEWVSLGAAKQADALVAGGGPPFVMVMPGGAYSYGINYETFLVSDLLPNVQCRYPVRADSTGQTLGGISLGGYWALRTAFQYPHLFAAVGGHSPVVDQGGPDDPWTLAGTISGTARLPVLLDVGTGDALWFQTRALASTLQGNGAAVIFADGAGGHEPAYWSAHMGEYLGGYRQFMLPATSWPGWLTPPRACSGRQFVLGLG